MFLTIIAVALVVVGVVTLPLAGGRPPGRRHKDDLNKLGALAALALLLVGAAAVYLLAPFFMSFLTK